MWAVKLQQQRGRGRERGRIRAQKQNNNGRQVACTATEEGDYPAGGVYQRVRTEAATGRRADRQAGGQAGLGFNVRQFDSLATLRYLSLHVRVCVCVPPYAIRTFQPFFALWRGKIAYKVRNSLGESVVSLYTNTHIPYIPYMKCCVHYVLETVSFYDTHTHSLKLSLAMRKGCLFFYVSFSFSFPFSFPFSFGSYWISK